MVGFCEWRAAHSPSLSAIPSAPVLHSGAERSRGYPRRPLEPFSKRGRFATLLYLCRLCCTYVGVSPSLPCSLLFLPSFSFSSSLLAFHLLLFSALAVMCWVTQPTQVCPRLELSSHLISVVEGRELKETAQRMK